MDFVMIMLLAIIAVVVAIMLPLVLRATRRQSDSGHTFDPLYVTGDYLVANTLAGGPRYYIDEIHLVQFGIGCNRGNWYGMFRVHKKGGSRGRKFMFDGSAFTRKRQLRSTCEEIEQAIAILQAQLKTHGIPSVKKL